MAYPLASKGFIQRKRESVLAIIADTNMTPTHCHIFERLLIFASPFSFKLEISDGVIIKKVELPHGSIVTSIDKLVELTHCCRNTLFTKLKDLHKWEYIIYGSFDTKSGVIKYTRKSNQHQHIYIQVKDYDYHVEVGSPKFGLPEEIGNPKFVLPEDVSNPKFVLPMKSVTQNLTVGNPKFALPNPHNSNNDSNLSGLLIQQQQMFNKQQQENVVVELQNLFYEKSKVKIPQNVCQNLVSKFLIEDIKTNILRLKFKGVDNPIGLLIRSLEEGYKLLPTQDEKIEIDKKASEEKQLEQKKEFEEEKKKLELEKQKFKLLEERYNSLSKENQEKLRNKAIAEIIEENKGIGEKGINFMLKKEKFIKIKIMIILEREGNMDLVSEIKSKKEVKGTKRLWDRLFG